MGAAPPRSGVGTAVSWRAGEQSPVGHSLSRLAQPATTKAQVNALKSVTAMQARGHSQYRLEVRPETRPRHLVSIWSECARAADSGSSRNPWLSWGGRWPGERGPHEVGMQRAAGAPEVRSGFSAAPREARSAGGGPGPHAIPAACACGGSAGHRQVQDGPHVQRRAHVLNPIRNREAKLPYGP